MRLNDMIQKGFRAYRVSDLDMDMSLREYQEFLWEVHKLESHTDKKILYIKTNFK